VFKFQKTNQKVRISYVSPQYSSQICAKWIEIQVDEWKKDGSNESIQIKSLVTDRCYPVAVQGSRIRNDKGEWFYCAGHGTLESWTNRDQNASENFTELQWIYRHNAQLKRNDLSTTMTNQASSPLAGGDPT
jgi:hypothetical protein